MLDTLFQIAALLLGVILGSFLNALLFRFNTGRSVAQGRSRCMHCGHVLSVPDLVPIASFIFLRGRCRYCGAKLSLQYPLVEAAGGCVSLLVYLAHPTLLGYLFWLLVWMTLLFIVVYDLRHKVIPWSASILLGLLALLSLVVSFTTSPVFFFTPDIWSLLSGVVLAAPLFLLSLVSRGRWMGWGDAPLEASLGWLLGLSAGATALMLSFWTGALVGIALIIFKKGLTMKSELPFAPFLVLGAFIAHFFHVDFFSSLPFLF